MEKLRIGYIGIGLMGLPMTLRLLERDYAVTVCDIVTARTDAAHEAGAMVVATPAEAVSGNEIGHMRYEKEKRRAMRKRYSN